LKIPVLLRLAWASQHSEVLDLFRVGALTRTQSERLRRLALASGLYSAKKIGPAIPPNVLARADKVIK
jgi:hypothetical protein